MHAILEALKRRREARRFEKSSHKDIRVKEKRNRAFFPVVIWIVVALWAFLFLLLLGWGVVQSLKDGNDFFENSIGFPSKEYGWKWSNYLLVFKEMKVGLPSGEFAYFPQMLGYTLLYVFLYSFLGSLGGLVCSYVYAKYSKRIRWTKALWVIVLISMYVPLSASMGASIELAFKLHIYDNLILFSLSTLGVSGNFLIYYATWKSVSWEYAEAAFIDGAGHFSVFFRIMLPMVRTIYMVLFITSVITMWADYSTPMIYLPSTPTIAYGVYAFQNSVGAGVETPVKIASIVATALPMFIIFMVFKDKMMGSLTMGGLKG